MKEYWTDWEPHSNAIMIAEIKKGKDWTDFIKLSKIIHHTGHYKNWGIGTETSVSKEEIVDERGVFKFVFEEMGR